MPLAASRPFVLVIYMQMLIRRYSEKSSRLWAASAGSKVVAAVVAVVEALSWHCTVGQKPVKAAKTLRACFDLQSR